MFDYWSVAFGIDINLRKCLVIFAKWYKSIVSLRLKVMPRKLTILRLDDISVLNPSNLNALIISLCIF